MRSIKIGKNVILMVLKINPPNINRLIIILAVLPPVWYQNIIIISSLIFPNFYWTFSIKGILIIWKIIYQQFILYFIFVKSLSSKNFWYNGGVSRNFSRKLSTAFDPFFPKPKILILTGGQKGTSRGKGLTVNYFRK